MTLAGEVTSCFGKADINAFGCFYSVGECMYQYLCSQAGSIPVPAGQSNCKVWHFLFFPVSGITSNCLLFRMYIFMSDNYYQIHISKMNHWMFLQNKTEKEKTT